MKELGLDCKLFYTDDKRGQNGFEVVERGELRKMGIEVFRVSDRLMAA